MKGYRTVLANCLGAVIPIIETSGLANVLTDEQMRFYVIGMIAANLILRLVTTTAVGRAE